MQQRNLKSEYFYILGAKVEASWIIGIGPLLEVTGIAGGLTFIERRFDLFLTHYPIPFTSGQLRGEPFDGDREGRLKEFRRVYNMVSHALDCYHDTDLIPDELKVPPAGGKKEGEV